MDSVLAPQILAATNEPQFLDSEPRTIVLPYPPHSERPENKPAQIRLGGPSGPGYEAVFLNFENMVGTGVPPVYDVYVGLPPGAEADERHDAGAIPFYGLEDSSTPGPEHAGTGLSVVLDITYLYTQLSAQSGWDSSQLSVRLYPRKPMPEDAAVSIGRVSLYVQPK